MVEEVQRKKTKFKRKLDSKIKNVLRNVKIKNKLIDQLKKEQEILEDTEDFSAKPLTDKQIKEGIKLRRAKGGEVKGYMGGGSVHGYRKGGSVKNKKAGRLAKRGYGICKK